MRNTTTKKIIHKPSEKRQTSKAKRNFGMKYLNSKNIDQVVWSQEKDPFFKIKGKERFRLINS